MQSLFFTRRGGPDRCGRCPAVLVPARVPRVSDGTTVPVGIGSRACATRSYSAARDFAATR